MGIDLGAVRDRTRVQALEERLQSVFCSTTNLGRADCSSNPVSFSFSSFFLAVWFVVFCVSSCLKKTYSVM